MFNFRYRLGLTLIATTFIVSSTVQAAPVFSDVKDAWYTKAILRAVDRKVIHGFPDGTFRPGDYVTEAHFLTMILNGLKKDGYDETYYESHWADAVYKYAEKQNYPVLGLTNIEKRNVPITRKTVAEIVTAVTGVNYTGDYAIQYLLTKGLANGKVPGVVSVEAFKGGDKLTRAEAAAFVMNLLDKGLRTAEKRPATASSVADLPKLPEPEKVKPANTLQEKLEQAAKKYPGYTAHVGDTGAGFADGPKGATVVYVKTEQTIEIYDALSDDALKATVDMLNVVGINTPSDFWKTLKDVNSTGKQKIVTLGGKKVSIVPSPYLMTSMYLYLK